MRLTVDRFRRIFFTIETEEDAALLAYALGAPPEALEEGLRLTLVSRGPAGLVFEAAPGKGPPGDPPRPSESSGAAESETASASGSAPALKTARDSDVTRSRPNNISGSREPRRTSPEKVQPAASASASLPDRIVAHLAGAGCPLRVAEIRHDLGLSESGQAVSAVLQGLEAGGRVTGETKGQIRLWSVAGAPAVADKRKGSPPCPTCGGATIVRRSTGAIICLKQECKLSRTGRDEAAARDATSPPVASAPPPSVVPLSEAHERLVRFLGAQDEPQSCASIHKGIGATTTVENARLALKKLTKRGVLREAPAADGLARWALPDQTFRPPPAPLPVPPAPREDVGAVDIGAGRQEVPEGHALGPVLDALRSRAPSWCSASGIVEAMRSRGRAGLSDDAAPLVEATLQVQRRLRTFRVPGLEARQRGGRWEYRVAETDGEA